MEEKIMNSLDNLTINQTEQLLNKDIEIKIGSKDMRRIKSSVYRKTGFKHKKDKYVYKKLIACAAVFAIILTSLSLVGFTNVAAAIGKLFSFIPGYGIVENNRSIEYILSQPVSTENEKFKLSLNNAIATKNSITVMLTLERKDFDEQQLIKDKQSKTEDIKNGSSSLHQEVSLTAGNRKITEYTGFTGSGGKIDTSTFSYYLESGEIGTNETYKLEYADYGLSLEFKLINYDSYNTLEEIGVTEYNNDISITAIPAFSDRQIQVDLYAVNNSEYNLYSFCKDFKAYMDNDLHLETNSGIKSYTIPEGYNSSDGRFLFDVEPDDKEFILKIPYINIRSNEEKNVAIKIPKEGEKVMVNQKIKFKDCTMTIVDVEKTSHRLGGELKMTINYENKTDNMVMLYADFNRTSSYGNGKRSDSVSFDMDENGVFTTVYFALDEDESGKLKLKVSNPRYCLTDEYKLELSR